MYEQYGFTSDASPVTLRWQAKQNGIAERTLYRAKQDLKIKSSKAKGVRDAPWKWELPSKVATERKWQSSA
jgi:hypothetical protein